MEADSGNEDYSAIIRTYCSFPVVGEVIGALRRQSVPPREVIVVDSGSPEDERSCLRELADRFIEYPAEPFNFSKAANIGIDRATTPCCLIISSHFLIEDELLMEHCIRAAAGHGTPVFYVSNVRRKQSRRLKLVSAGNFTGSNGFSNA